jgi:hypothetical protein
VEVLPSGKGNRAFWSDHGKAFVVTYSGDREKKNSKEAKLLRSQEAPCTAIGAYHQLLVIPN